MKQSFEIEKALTLDAKAIKECVNAAYQHYIERLEKMLGPMLDDYEQLIEHQNVYLARQNMAIAGILVLVRCKLTFLIDNIAVHPKFQRQGLGQQLMVFAEQQARKRGFKYIDLYTHELMIENINIYLKLGYVEIERKTVRGFDRVYMRKDLDE